MVDLPEQSQIKAADVFVTADNLFTLYVNGRLAGQSSSNPDDWSHAKRFNVAGLLVPGCNVLAVEAVNTGGPAGLLAKLVVWKAGGQTVLSVTEWTWKANEKRVANWQSPAFDDKAWPAAHVVVPYGSGPWGRFAGDLALLPAESPWPAKRRPTGNRRCTIWRPARRRALQRNRRPPTIPGLMRLPSWAKIAASIKASIPERVGTAWA